MIDFPGKTLLLAIGNSSRGDDGLGWAFASALEEAGFFPGEIVYRYQLQIEDAELCSHYDQVIFADAWKTDSNLLFAFEPCLPKADSSFTTHAVSPPAILQLCKDIYEVEPKSWLVLLRGARWGLGEGLSQTGKKGLKEGVAFFYNALHQRSLS